MKYQDAFYNSGKVDQKHIALALRAPRRVSAGTRLFAGLTAGISVAHYWTHRASSHFLISEPIDQYQVL